MAREANTGAGVHDHDVVLVGGGLQNGLIALACLRARPHLRIALVERTERVGGNHTWAVHEGDVPEDARAFVEPLWIARWDGYDVRFPRRERTLLAPYAAIGSERFAAVVEKAIQSGTGSALWLGRAAQRVAADHVVLDTGTVLRAPLIVDARGPSMATMDHADGVACGYQKFLGQELELYHPHGLERPMLMDATVEQTDGFRFFYVLPLDARRLLVEDTTFSRSPRLDRAALRSAVLRYAQRFGAVARVAREELGVLPMPWGPMPAPALEGPLVAGYRGGFFHPATGYSLPIALRLACLIARLGPERAVGHTLRAFAQQHLRQASFARQLNRLLFTGFAPGSMRNVFERFYALPEDVIARFYGLRTSALDRARILLGRPPEGFSLVDALGELP